MPVVEALNQEQRAALWRASHNWSVHLLSFICTKTLMQGANDRDAGTVPDFIDPDQARDSHRFDAHLRSCDGRFVVKISTVGPPNIRKAGDYIALSVFNTEYADSARDNRPLAVLDTVILPWYDTQSMPHVATADVLMNEQPSVISSLRNLIAEAQRIDPEEFDTIVGSPVTVSAETTQAVQLQPRWYPHELIYQDLLNL